MAQLIYCATTRYLMPKAIPQSELETIHGIVKQLPAGAFGFEDFLETKIINGF